MSISPTNDDIAKALSQEKKRGKISAARKVIIFSNINRHLAAIMYLVAELVLGFKPEKL